MPANMAIHQKRPSSPYQTKKNVEKTRVSGLFKTTLKLVVDVNYRKTQNIIYKICFIRCGGH